MKKERENKGITLIALIITIIVMMILVGVTVTVTIDGGLFEKVKQAKRENEKALWRDNLETTIFAMKTDIESSKEYEFELNDDTFLEIFTILLTTVQENFELDNKYVVEVSDEDYSILNYEQLYAEGYIDDTFNPIRVPCKYNGKDIVVTFELEINEDAEVARIAEVYASTNSIVVAEKDDPVEVTVGSNVTSVTEDGVPIPKGFYYVTGTKDTGVVISDSQADENNSEGNNGNQFVWVPVNVNPRLEIEIDSENIIEEVKIESTDGYDETINVNSQYYKKVINLTGNAIYQVSVKYIDGTTEEIIREVNNTYAIYNLAYTTVSILAVEQGMSTDGLLEQVIQEELEKNPEQELTKMSYLTTLSSGLLKYTDDVSEKENVLKYGGFYIGRYEASLNDGVKKGIKPSSGGTYEQVKAAVENVYTDTQKYGVTAGVPSGAAWDAIGGWLTDTGTKNVRNLYYDSQYWGNYKPKSITSTNSLKNTGASEKYSANNIYDLAGNLHEWTKTTLVEKNSETNLEEITARIARGGAYDRNGYSNFGSAEEIDADTSTSTVGIRPMLYINY